MMPEISLIGVLIVAAIAFTVPLGLGFVPTLRVPSVVLEIAAGILIGPAVLGLVEVDLPLQVLALLGLAFLLFLAGLEIDLDRLRGSRLRSAAAGFVVSLAVALGIGLGLYATGLIQAPLLLAIILSATSLGIVIPVLADAGQSTTTLGQLVIAGSSIADFGAIILLSLFFSGDSSSVGWEIVGAHEPYRRVLEQQLPERQPGLGVGGVGGDRPVRRERLGVEREVAPEGDLHDAIRARPAGDLPDPGSHVFCAVVQGVVGASLHSQPRLLLRAHGRDHRGAAPLRERDSEAAHRPRAPGHQHRLALHGPSAKTQRWAVRAGMPRHAPTSKPTPSGRATACASGTATYSAVVPKDLPLCAPHTLSPTRE
jgi:hypothetical protein